jgi:hypothetical protein
MDRYIATCVGKRQTDEGIEWSGQYLRPGPSRQADYQLRAVRACDVPAAGGTVRFDVKPIAAVTKADIEAIRSVRRPYGVIRCNRLLARLRHFFNWAIGEGFTETSPFKRHGVSVVKQARGPSCVHCPDILQVRLSGWHGRSVDSTRSMRRLRRAAGQRVYSHAIRTRRDGGRSGRRGSKRGSDCGGRLWSGADDRI